MDQKACNYNKTAVISSESCLQNDVCGVCGGPGRKENFTCDGKCTVTTDVCGQCGGTAVDAKQSCPLYLFKDIGGKTIGSASLMKKEMGALQNTKYDRSFIPGYTVDKCALACINTAGCLSIEYTAAYSRCYLHKSATTESATSSSSYVRYDLAYGCATPGKVNYDKEAKLDDGSCYPSATRDEKGNCKKEALDMCGVCGGTDKSGTTCPEKFFSAPQSSKKLSPPSSCKSTKTSSPYRSKAYYPTVNDCLAKCFEDAKCRSVDYWANGQQPACWMRECKETDADAQLVTSSRYSHYSLLKGCMDKSSCTYDKTAILNNSEACKSIDSCGVCGGIGPKDPDGKPSNKYNCKGECVAGVDCENVCGGSKSNDCKGVCGGSAKLDSCSVCGGTGASCTTTISTTSKATTSKATTQTDAAPSGTSARVYVSEGETAPPGKKVVKKIITVTEKVSRETVKAEQVISLDFTLAEYANQKTSYETSFIKKAGAVAEETTVSYTSVPANGGRRRLTAGSSKAKWFLAFASNVDLKVAKAVVADPSFSSEIAKDTGLTLEAVTAEVATIEVEKKVQKEVFILVDDDTSDQSTPEGAVTTSKTGVDATNKVTPKVTDNAAATVKAVSLGVTGRVADSKSMDILNPACKTSFDALVSMLVIAMLLLL